MITFGTARHHWNYYLAIENDLEKVSRYIEFSTPNLDTYSIELAHILLSASSEIDVIMKQLCALIDPTLTTDNINHYKDIIQNNLAQFCRETVSIDRYGMNVCPWENWLGATNPDWWRSYNRVKHERNNHFNEASLQNTINAVGALLITAVYFYKLSFTNEAGHDLEFQDTTRQLIPSSSFFRLDSRYYYRHLIDFNCTQQGYCSNRG